MISTHKPSPFAVVAALLVAGPLVAQTDDSPQQILREVEARLLAWDTAGAREAFDRLSGRGGAAARVAAGRLLAQEGKLDEAVAALSAVVEAAPADPAPAIHLGSALTVAKRAEEAGQAFAMAAERAATGLQSAPEDVDLLVALGVARRHLGELPKAIGALERARELAPNKVEPTYELGVCHAISRNWGQAVDLLTQALEKNPRIAYAYYFRGLAADKVDRKDLLINDLNRFLDLAPDSPDAPRVRSILSAVQG
jgi:tetratricopeptide (TPR) repeat protein